MSKATNVATFTCDECGYSDHIALPIPNGIRIKCPMCNHVEVFLAEGEETPKLKWNKDSVKCSVCPFDIRVCQECEEAVPWSN